MSENALKSLKDENPDLQKQIGCIAGFFQLFDRHRFLTGQSTSSYIQQTPTSVESNNDNKELNNKMQKTKAKSVKNVRDKQQFSTESSTASLSSSSCSSSMSSLEFNRTIQTESPSRTQITVATNPPSEITMKQHDKPSQKSLEFCDIVKDSIYREAQGLSLKTVVKEKKKGQTHTLKHIDSPRPLQPHKSTNGGVMVANEPFHVLSKSKKSPWDLPRLSYDGRDTQDKFKSTTKHKEFPRLSLDSKQGSTRGFNEGNKAHNLLKDPHKGNGRQILNQTQEPDSSKRSASVVAKLMGLEALPERTQTCVSSSDDTITNVTPYSRFALEPSPWRKPDARKRSQSQDSNESESGRKSSLSVYGEIEKRVSELEFKKSGKDLRALKQILEAMQRYKDPSDVARDQASNLPSSNQNNTSSISESSKVKSPRIRQKDPASVTVEKSNSGKLPIVIKKPARVTRKANNSSSPSIPRNGRLGDMQTAKVISSTTKNAKDKNNNLRNSKLIQSSKVFQDTNGESAANSGNMTPIGSPRLLKKFGLERRSPPTSPSSDSSINRSKHNRQPVELTSPSSTPRQNFTTLQKRNEHFGDISHHLEGVKHHVNFISPDFDRKGNLATHSDIEVIHIGQSGKINSTSIRLSDLNRSDVFEELRKESSKAETVVNAEQPSPVSVLDSAFYREDPPSPVRKKSDLSKYLGETLSTDDDDRDSNTQSLVEILKEIDWIDEKFLNFSNSKDPDHKYVSEILIASGLLSGHSSSQILYSQGHLINPKLFLALEEIKTNKRDFSIEDSPKKISRIISPDQLQRKLIFDVVNDILAQKLILESSSTLCCLPNELEGSKLKGQKLLDNLCTEIDQLQPQKRNFNLVPEDENLSSVLCGDLKHHHPIWTNCYSEIPNVVLDIERLIFKDLITETVTGEVANLCGRYCRQLLFRK